MYPEAGGSSSFARRAFNEFWSFFAAWAQMLTYIATIAISAFFVPHYIGGLFWDGAAPLARRHHRRRVVIVVLARRSTSSASRSRPASTSLLAVIDFLTQVLLVLVGVVRSCSRRRRWSTTSTSASRRRGTTSSSRSRSACSPTRASRRSRTWPRRPGTRRRRSRPRSTACGSPCSRSTSRCRPSRCRRCRSRRTPTASTTTLLGLPEEQGGYAGDPILGVVKQIDLGPLQNVGGDLRRPAGRDDPLPGHQRGHDRRLAARLLDGHPPPAARPRCASCTRSYRTPWIGILVFSAFAIAGDPAGPGGVPRQPLLVRRAAVVHDRARLGGRACGSTQPDFPRPYRGPGNVTHPRLRRAAVRDRRRHVHRDRVRRDRRPQPGGGGRSASAGWLFGIVVYVAFRRRQGLDLTSTHKVAIPQPVVDHEAEYDSVLVPLRRRRLRRAGDRHRGQARRPQAPRDPRAGDRHGPERAADRRADARGRRRPRESLIEQAQGAGRRGACPATSSGCAPARPGGGSSRRRSTCARRRS